MSCLGPQPHPGQAVIDAYDAGRASEAPRDAGTLPARDGALRDALLLAPEPPSGETATEFVLSYLDWWRDVRGPALDLVPRPPDKLRRLIATMLGAPDPLNYERSLIGADSLRHDLTVWSERALVLIAEATK